MTKSKKSAAEASSSGIDNWIAEHGLDAQIDNMIRTCGYDHVLACLKAAPARFAERRERVLGYRPSQRSGAPVKRDGAFYEVLVWAVETTKARHRLTDKDACGRLCRELAAVKKQDPKALDLLGLSDVADLEGKTLYRQYKRMKAHIRSIADAAVALEREVRLSGRKGKGTVRWPSKPPDEPSRTLVPMPLETAMALMPLAPAKRRIAKGQK